MVSGPYSLGSLNLSNISLHQLKSPDFNISNWCSNIGSPSTLSSQLSSDPWLSPRPQVCLRSQVQSRSRLLSFMSYYQSRGVGQSASIHINHEIILKQDKFHIS